LGWESRYRGIQRAGPSLTRRHQRKYPGLIALRSANILRQRHRVVHGGSHDLHGPSATWEIECASMPANSASLSTARINRTDTRMCPPGNARAGRSLRTLPEEYPSTIGAKAWIVGVLPSRLRRCAGRPPKASSCSNPLSASLLCGCQCTHCGSFLPSRQGTCCGLFDEMSDGLRLRHIHGVAAFYLDDR